MAGSLFLNVVLFICFFMFCLFLLFCYCLSVVNLPVIPCFFYVVLLGACICFCFCFVYFFLIFFLFIIEQCSVLVVITRVARAACLSNLVRVICCDHCGSVCPGSLCDRMSYLVAYCSHCSSKKIIVVWSTVVILPALFPVFFLF
jgi:hypothetical protein